MEVNGDSSEEVCHLFSFESEIVHGDDVEVGRNYHSSTMNILMLKSSF